MGMLGQGETIKQSKKNESIRVSMGFVPKKIDESQSNFANVQA